MRKIAFTAVALLPLTLLAQEPFSVTGNITGLMEGSKIYLIYKAGGTDVADSAVVNKNTFVFKGQLEEPTRASLFLNKNPFVSPPGPGEVIDFLSLYIEAAPIKITGTDSLKNATVSGSVISADDIKFRALIKPITDQLSAIDAEYNKLPEVQKKDNAVVRPLQERYNKAAAGLPPVFLSYVKNNPGSYISLAAIAQLAGSPEHAAEAESAFAGLSPEVKATKAGKELAQHFAAEQGTAIGAVAMDFTQNDVNDKPVKLSDFRGKYVLLDFWASWCIPCRNENPNVVKAYQTFKDKNFTVLGVSLDKPGEKKAWLAAIEKDGLTWTHVSDLKWWENAAARQYGIRGIPANFLIDPSGKIIAKNIRGPELQAKLAEVLGGKSK